MYILLISPIHAGVVRYDVGTVSQITGINIIWGADADMVQVIPVWPGGGGIFPVASDSGTPGRQVTRWSFAQLLTTLAIAQMIIWS